ncbi:hypothetical protein MKX03_032173 [Papaver bracteatum]|nr:hypothetical protein MKX03_032173 [Papaver bracteatum]
MHLVERLTFKEFFGHLFLSTHKSKESSSSQDDCMPFILDDDTSGPDASLSHPSSIGSMRFDLSIFMFFLDFGKFVVFT